MEYKNLHPSFVEEKEVETINMDESAGFLHAEDSECSYAPEEAPLKEVVQVVEKTSEPLHSNKVIALQEWLYMKSKNAFKERIKHSTTVDELERSKNLNKKKNAYLENIIVGLKNQNKENENVLLIQRANVQLVPKQIEHIKQVNEVLKHYKTEFSDKKNNYLLQHNRLEKSYNNLKETQVHIKNDYALRRKSLADELEKLQTKEANLKKMLLEKSSIYEQTKLNLHKVIEKTENCLQNKNKNYETLKQSNELLRRQYAEEKNKNHTFIKDLDEIKNILMANKAKKSKQEIEIKHTLTCKELEQKALDEKLNSLRKRKIEVASQVAITNETNDKIIHKIEYTKVEIEDNKNSNSDINLNEIENKLRIMDEQFLENSTHVNNFIANIKIDIEKAREDKEIRNQNITLMQSKHKEKQIEFEKEIERSKIIKECSNEASAKNLKTDENLEAAKHELETIDHNLEANKKNLEEIDLKLEKEKTIYYNQIMEETEKRIELEANLKDELCSVNVAKEELIKKTTEEFDVKKKQHDEILYNLDIDTIQLRDAIAEDLKVDKNLELTLDIKNQLSGILNQKLEKTKNQVEINSNELSKLVKNILERRSKLRSSGQSQENTSMRNDGTNSGRYEKPDHTNRNISMHNESISSRFADNKFSQRSASGRSLNDSFHERNNASVSGTGNVLPNSSGPSQKPTGILKDPSSAPMTPTKNVRFKPTVSWESLSGSPANSILANPNLSDNKEVSVMEGEDWYDLFQWSSPPTRLSKQINPSQRSNRFESPSKKKKSS